MAKELVLFSRLVVGVYVGEAGYLITPLHKHLPTYLHINRGVRITERVYR